jgi:erythromycin esterase-like protein
MARVAAAEIADLIREAGHPLTGSAADYDPLLERVGDARYVLLGAATHGSHEFYRTRAEITRRLIREKGFHAIAVEADWPDAYRVNWFVRGLGRDSSATEALSDFKRFPTWMWRNAAVLDFLGWLREYNLGRPTQHRTGFYGLDLYSLYSSAEAVLRYLDRVDPPAALQARRRYGCLDHRCDDDPQKYGFTASLGLRPSCEREVLDQLIALRERAAEYMRRSSLTGEDQQFYAEQNANLVRDAEAYYRELFTGRVSTWNVRDRHMTDTLLALADHLTRRVGTQAKIVVWEHNSHIGDARATEMRQRGEINVGQVIRERYAQNAVLVGMTTFSGTLTAASEWDAPAERKHVRPALRDSYEHLFHNAWPECFLLRLDRGEVADTFSQSRLERAIGVIYLPETERVSHYFSAHLSQQFDVVLHFDKTRAVDPLEPTPQWHAGEPPETFPFGV